MKPNAVFVAGLLFMILLSARKGRENCTGELEPTDEDEGSAIVQAPPPSVTVTCKGDWIL